MKKKLQSFQNKGDSAQQNYSTKDPLFEKSYRNALFDRLVNSGIECYVALRKDFIKNNYFHHNLFCGQVGEIENVILEKKIKNVI